MSAGTSQKTSSIREGYAELVDIRLHYLESGQPGNELVLLLHGFPEFSYSWRHQLPVLGERYHVVAPDMRGYNLSGKPPHIKDYAIDVLVGDVIQLMDHFGAASANVVGHDWGAGVAWAIAQKHPERVARLAVMQVPPAPVWRKNMGLRQMTRSWYMLFFQLPRIPEWAMSRKNFGSIDRTFREMVINKEAFDDEDVRIYKEAMQQPGSLTAAINYYRANLKRLTSGGKNQHDSVVNRRVPMPTLFIFGEQDFAIIPRTVRGVKDYVSGPYREMRLPNCGHWVQNEAVEEVNRELLAFLESDKAIHEKR
jgi:pimeloyl-ACP methyl ester carboxylesterase